MPSIAENMRKQLLSNTVGENVSWFSSIGELLGNNLPILKCLNPELKHFAGKISLTFVLIDLQNLIYKEVPSHTHFLTEKNTNKIYRDWICAIWCGYPK